MKNTVIVLFLLLGITVQAQEKKVEIVPELTQGIVIQKIPFEDVKLITSVDFNYRFGTTTSVAHHIKSEPAFKTYKLLAENENWNTQNDVYNSIRAKVPGVRISSTYLNETPTITTRGCDDTVVIVDGVRFDVDILKTLNPADIQSIAVSNSVAATNYFLNNRN